MGAWEGAWLIDWLGGWNGGMWVEGGGRLVDLLIRVLELRAERHDGCWVRW